MLFKALFITLALAAACFAQTSSQPIGQSPQQAAQPANAQAAAAQPQPQAPAYQIKDLGHGINAVISGRAGGNSGFIIGDDGVLVVDTFVDAAAARILQTDIRKATPLPVRFVVNTHYHLDHVAGNAVFAECSGAAAQPGPGGPGCTGATIVAHMNVRRWLRTENLKFFSQNGATPTPEQRARVESLVLPTLMFEGIMQIQLGNRTIYLRTLPGHTGGDTAVYIPDGNVVFLGDLGWNHRIPNLIDASTGPWIETLDLALKAHPQATFIPGHGDVATAADIKEFRDYLAALRDAIKRAQGAGQSGDALTQSVLTELKPKYGAWPGFDRLGPLNIQQTAAELAGSKKIPQPGM